MKVLLGGWEGSKKLVSACSYLVSKYLGNDFDVYFLNTGPFEGKLYCGQYVDIGQVGNTAEEWMKAMVRFFESLDDEFIIWASDDFLLSRKIDMDIYNKILNKMKEDPKIACGKLCLSLFHKPSEYDEIGDDMFMLNETAQYSSVVQLNIWRREPLIHFMKISSTPWDFELDGSKRLNESGWKVIGSFDSALKYPDRTAMSKTHPGKVSVLGNKVDDVEFLIEAGHLERDQLIMGLWPGDVKTYEEGKDDQLACLEGNSDREYNETLVKLCLEENV